MAGTDDRRYAGAGAALCALRIRICGGCEGMTEVSKATMLNYVNPMAMNTGYVCPLSAYQVGRTCAIRYRERRKNWRAT